MDTSLHHTLKRCSGTFKYKLHSGNKIKQYMPCYAVSYNMSGCCPLHNIYIFNKKHEIKYVLKRISFITNKINNTYDTTIKLMHMTKLAKLICRHKGIFDDEFINCIVKKLHYIDNNNKTDFTLYIKYLLPSLCEDNKEYMSLEKDLLLYHKGNKYIDDMVLNISI